MFTHKSKPKDFTHDLQYEMTILNSRSFNPSLREIKDHLWNYFNRNSKAELTFQLDKLDVEPDVDTCVRCISRMLRKQIPVYNRRIDWLKEEVMEDTNGKISEN